MARIQIGNAEVSQASLLKLCAIAGQVGEDEDEPDAVYVKFTRDSYTRDEVVKLLELITDLGPDEVSIDGADDSLRLWWD
jgi:hypothetical protein